MAVTKASAPVLISLFPFFFANNSRTSGCPVRRDRLMGDRTQSDRAHDTDPASTEYVH
jgi:hypothetical protein